MKEFVFRTGLWLFLWLPLVAAGQEAVSVTGRVTDGAGRGVGFATVRVANVGVGTGADAEGRYELRLPVGRYVLEASAVGYVAARQEVRVERKAVVVDFRLAEDTVQLAVAEVRGKGRGRQLREGVYAAKVLEVKERMGEVVDLNDWVDRMAGVRVRSEGGLGAETDLALNGMSGDAVRYFIDEVPMDVRGEGMTLGRLPAGTVERIEVYKGVVPSYLGADAMGGAVHVVTRREKEDYVDVSYSVGSFHSHVADVNGLHVFPRSGLVVKAGAGVSYSRNDYVMRDVELWDEEAGRYAARDVRRFHDGFLSFSAEAEVGVERKPWADALYVSVSYNQEEKELQSGSIQSIVYGMAERRGKTWQAGVRYNRRDFLTEGLQVNGLLSQTWERSVTVDTAYRKYRWDGTYVRTSRNEITGGARQERHYVRPLTVVRVNADYAVGAEQRLNVNYMLHRSGNRRYDERDEEFVPSNDVLAKHVTGISYSGAWLGERLAGSVFMKDYVYHVKVRQRDMSWITNSDEVPERATKHYAGYGLGVRYAFGVGLAVKGSYEHAVRLPMARELLGNGVTVYANLALRPETSHNVNGGVYGDWKVGAGHTLAYEVNGFFRKTEDYIRAVLSESDGTVQYRNEQDVTTAGVEGEVGYRWGERLWVTANGSYERARNMTRLNEEGKPSVTYKNRVPNKPWLFGNVETGYAAMNVFCRGDRLKVGYYYQYVHWFFLTWEGYGSLESKSRIPTQHRHTVGADYSWGEGRYSVAMECDNLFDRKLYDNFMLQKPGRAFTCKFRVFIHK